MLSLKREWPSSPWVFTLDGERPITKSAIREAWERARDLAGMPGLFDRYGIRPEKTLIDAVRRMELAEKSAQSKRRAGREACEA